MRPLKTITVLSLLVFIACGDSTGPDGPEVSPSILTVVFTGSTDQAAYGIRTLHDARTGLTGDGTGHDGTASICRITASWTMCTDHGFDSYRLYRSLSPGIASDTASALLVNTVESYGVTSCVDETVTWDTEYHYALRTMDSNGEGAWSNEVSITTPQVDPPTPSELTLAELTWAFSELSWTTCPEPNFLSYRLYRSVFPDIQQDTSAAVLMELKDWRLDTVFVDTTIEASTLYHYALLTTNTEGVSSWSNEVEVGTYENVPGTVTATVPVGPGPWDAAPLPSGQYVYVSCRGADAVYVIRTSDMSVVATVPVGDSPYGVCAGVSGEFVYTANWGSHDMSVIRTADNTVVETVPVGGRPQGVCVLPSGDFLYVTNRDDGTVTVISVPGHQVVETVQAGVYPYGICSLPSGEYVYVTNFGSHDMSVIRTSDNTVTATVDLFTHPSGVCALPSGQYVYASNFNNDVVAVVRTSDNAIIETVKVGNGPWGLCAHPGGLCVYAANSGDGTVAMVRTSDNKVVAELNTGASPSGICSLPSGSAVFVMNYGDGTVSVLQ